MTALLVSLLAGVGAVTRFGVDRAVPRRSFPLGTLVVNSSGSLLLGLLLGLAAHHGASAQLVTVLGAGFAGGYTTLSTFAYETVDLTLTGRRRTGTSYAVLSVALGLAGAAAGLALAQVHG